LNHIEQEDEDRKTTRHNGKNAGPGKYVGETRLPGAYGVSQESSVSSLEFKSFHVARGVRVTASPIFC